MMISDLERLVDAIQREKNIPREVVIEILESAMEAAGRKCYGMLKDIEAQYNPELGEVELFEFRTVVEDVEDEHIEIHIDEARDMDPECQMGDSLGIVMDVQELGRIAAQTAKQVIVSKVREAERQRQFKEYQDRTGEVVNGLVKRVEFGNVIVDLGRAEALLRRDESIPREHFNNGDRIRAYIVDVREEARGPQIFLSRTHPQFMAKLFTQEVPEIYDGIIEIKAVARDPGSRAKMAVLSHDSSIDPVGPCIGMRGSRVQAVVGELQGEKIDIIQWSPDPATFIVNALAPAEVAKVVLDEEKNKIEVVVPDEQLSLAIGRRGQNVRLASQLSGWDIDILTEAEESDRRKEEFDRRSQLFIECLDVDDVIAHLLVTEGFTSVEQVAFVPVDDLVDIEGFDEDISEELRARARNFLEQRDAQLSERCVELGVSDAIAAIDGITPAIMVAIGENQVKTLDDLADLAGDELIEMLPGGTLSQDMANEIIMAARAHWFEDDAAPDTDEAAAGEGEDEDKTAKE